MMRQTPLLAWGLPLLALLLTKLVENPLKRWKWEPDTDA